MKSIHLKDSITQSTAIHQFDKELNYFQPYLQIVTHKQTPNLRDQTTHNKTMPRLRQYLQAEAPNTLLTEPTGANLEAANSQWKSRVSEKAPIKDHQQLARLRQPAQKCQKRPFSTVGLQNPNPTKQDLKVRD